MFLQQILTLFRDDDYSQTNRYISCILFIRTKQRNPWLALSTNFGTSLCKVYLLFTNWIRLVDRCERLKEQQRRYFPSVNPL